MAANVPNVPALADAAPIDGEVNALPPLPPPLPAYVAAPGLAHAFDVYLALELGMPLDLRTALAREGLTTFDLLRQKENEQIDETIRGIRKPGGTIQAGRSTIADPGIHVATAHTDALKQLAYGLRHCVRTQVQFDPTRHNVNWMLALDEFRKTIKKESITGVMPGKMTKTAKARESLDDVKRYLATVRGCNDAFLTYLIRETEAPIDSEAWISIDHELVGRAPLSGSTFCADNRKLYTILDTVFGSGEGHAWIKSFAATLDGRGAYWSLYNHYITKAARNKVVTDAESILDNLKYTSESRGITFEIYVSRHQQAYNDLAREGRVLTEDERIKKLLKNIDSDVLAINKRLIRNDQLKADAVREYDTFEKVVSNLTLVLLDEGHTSSARRANVSGVQTGASGSAGGGRRRGGKQKQVSFTNKKSFLPASQWKAMSKEERDAFLAQRRQRRNGNQNNGNNGGGRGGGQGAGGGRNGSDALYHSQIAALQATVDQLSQQLSAGQAAAAPEQLGTQMNRRAGATQQA